MDVTNLIKEAINNTAKLLNNDRITTAEDMIPHMRTIMKEEEYPAYYKEDISYGLNKDAKFDIYYPDNIKGPYPVFVEVHGGAWFFGQKSSVEFKPFLHGLKRGYACVSAGYTLAPDAVYPTQVMEIKELIIYLKEHADELNIDKDRIILWGGSAGAHLAALAAYSEDSRYLKTDSVYDAKVNTLILWYGCFNYNIGKKLDHWIYCNFFGNENLSMVNNEILLSNPACHICADAPRTLLQHGLKDMVVSYEQSVYMYNVLKSIIGEENVRLDLIEDADHADIKLFAEENIKKVFDFIDEKK